MEISYLASLDMMLSNKQIIKALIRLRKREGCSAPLLFAPNLPPPPHPPPEDRFSQIKAHMIQYIAHLFSYTPPDSNFGASSLSNTL